MNAKLLPARFDDLNTILLMQINAFSKLYAKYQDTKTSPATEKYEDILFRFNQPETTYYFIMADNVKVGVIRIVDCKDDVTRKRISPIFIMPEYRNKGYAQQAIKEAERIHGEQHWKLDTKGNFQRLFVTKHAGADTKAINALKSNFADFEISEDFISLLQFSDGLSFLNMETLVFSR